jgi:hypothetical protein
MDANHFVRIARTLSQTGPRRGLLGLLATMPLTGGLFGLVGPDHTDAKAKGRRKPAHQSGEPAAEKKKRKKKCKSQAQICAGKCGSVTFKCKKRDLQKTVDCGACSCDPACDACFICDTTTRVCEPDPDQQGMPCGDRGQ